MLTFSNIRKCWGTSSVVCYGGLPLVSILGFNYNQRWLLINLIRQMNVSCVQGIHATCLYREQQMDDWKVQMCWSQRFKLLVSELSTYSFVRTEMYILQKRPEKCFLAWLTFWIWDSTTLAPASFCSLPTLWKVQELPALARCWNWMFPLIGVNRGLNSGSLLNFDTGTNKDLKMGLLM